MTSPPFDCTHGPQCWAWHAITALGLSDTVGRSHAWYAIIGLGRQTRSDNVGRGMPSPLLDSKHGQATSSVKCHHRFWTSHSVKQRRAWHAVIAFRQHKQSNNIRRGMTSPPLDYMHGLTTSGVARHHHPWTTQTVEQRRVLHYITALGLHAREDDVGRGMTSTPLDSTHRRQHRAWHDITAL